MKPFSYLYRNFLLPKILSVRYYPILKRNRALKNSRSGTCYILGSGPSMKDVDISRFADAPVITANNFYRHEQFGALKDITYVFSDTGIFNEYSVAILRDVERIAAPRLRFFFPIEGEIYFARNGMLQGKQISFFAARGIFSTHVPFATELDHVIPWPKNSLLLCLMIAVYLGFTKIYLLGFEHDFLCHSIGKSGDFSYRHFYNDPHLRMDPRDAQLSYEDNIANALQLFKNYRLFYQKLRREKPEVEIFNATPGSYLDVFPMISYADLP